MGATLTTAEAGTRLLVSIAVVVVAARAVGWFVARLHQPRVLGEIAAGILLGPSLLGVVWPGATRFLFAPEVLGGLRAISQLGLVLFMFLVGLELDPAHLRGQGRRALVISNASIVVPFGLGALAAVWLHPRIGGDASPLGFSLFMGIAMSITAFPVLARILQEVGLDRTRVGVLALTCAAIDDVTAWCALAVVVAIVEGTGWADVAITIAATLAVVLVALAVVRPALARVGRVSLPVAVALALGAAWTTEIIGVHAIFGAFLAGFVMPRREHAASGGQESFDPDDLSAVLTPLTSSVLLPVFFAVVGLSTRLGVLDDAERWLVLAVVLAVAVAGKLGGAALTARILGESWRDSVTIGVLMNTRGLTELVILTVGLDLGVLGPTAFAVMVTMALVTTLMAGPVLRRLGFVSVAPA